MKKEELAKAIFEERNRLRELNGEEPFDIDTPRVQRKLWDDSRRTKPDLESELETLRRCCEEQTAKNEHSAKVVAYYATPEGAAFKAETEAAIEKKIAEWEFYETQTRIALESNIQAVLGRHWGVVRLNKGNATIGVIDFEKSTPESREFHFGQHIDITYEQKYWDGNERFEANCGSTGSFSMEGGTTLGERAMFYVGIGRLFGNGELVASIKSILRESEQTVGVIGAELDELRARLANPFTEIEIQ